MRAPAKSRGKRPGGSRAVLIGALVVLVATGAFALSRVGLFDLPSVPGGISAEAAGLDHLDEHRQLDAFVRGQGGPVLAGEVVDPLADPKRAARIAVRDGVSKAKQQDLHEVENALHKMRTAIKNEPGNIVLLNAYRMEAFRLRLEFLREARGRGELTPKFPPHLDRQPIAFFEGLLREQESAPTPPPLARGEKGGSRETRLQLALAWVDEMLLFPALEIKAPSSVEAVDILTEILEQPGNENYVPALFARGLNHLHRPARLVWPETNKTPPDAAVRDIARCVAIGRKLKVGSPRLQAMLAMTLGDAYVKAGRFSVARSWWQIAQNLCHDDDIQQAVGRRYGWHDEEILDRLEQELDRARMELDRPMTDLAMMWN